VKRHLIALIVLAQLQGCVERPQRPTNIPPSATKVDEVFIQCSVETSLQANRCTVYAATSGNVLESGLFVLSGAGREAKREDLVFAAFDGTQILLADARKLYPVLLEELPVMQKRLQMLAGNDAIDCGIVRPTSTSVAASDCARHALAEWKSFYFYYVSPRGDSLGSVLAEGIAGDSGGDAYEVRYHNMRSFSWELRPGAQLSDGGYILTQRCPKPVHLWDFPYGKLTCVPSRE